MAVFEGIIPENLPPMRLDKYLQRALPELPAWAIREAFSRRDVKMDGLRVRPDEPARPGARVQVYGIPEAGTSPLDVVYEDEHILLVSKPAGISVQSDTGGGATMESLALAHVQKTDPGAWPPKACHRLDNQTCGLLLLAKTALAEELMTSAFKERLHKKSYICLVKGTPEPREAILRAFLKKDAEAAHVQILDGPAPGALPITTGYQVIEAGEVARLQVDLITGRTHQIRAHLAHIGHPILGDDAYGDRAFNREHHSKRLMLCAASLILSGKGELAYLDGRTFTVLPPF
jgi:23S rRNA pseudouridine955/2504/2580 synthase